MDSQTLALLSGLDANWENTFQSPSPLSISLQLTDTWNPIRQLGTDRTTAQTVGLMASHALHAASSQQVSKAIRDSGAPDTKELQECLKAIFQYIKRRVKFVEDNEPLGRMFGIADSKELLITPPALLSMKSPEGDCDDFSMLAASMMIACGIPCSFVTVAADGRAPETFTHVYCMGAGIPFDTSHGKEVGWETEKQFRKKVWPIVGWEGKGEGLGMIVGKEGYQKAWLNAGLRGLLGLGDDTDSDFSSAEGDFLASSSPILMTGPNVNLNDPALNMSSINPTGGGTSVFVPSNSSAATINWNNLLPGIFGSAEKIAQQTTQPAGYQITGPNGQTTSVVLPAGGTLPSISSLTSSLSSSGLMPLLLLGLAAIVVIPMLEGK